MKHYVRWLLPAALGMLLVGIASAEDSLFSRLGKLDPAAHKLLQEAYDESCIVLDSLDRLAKSRKSSETAITQDWSSIVANHRDHWSTRIEKAARLLGTNVQAADAESTSSDPALRVNYPSSYRTWVRVQGKFFEKVRTDGPNWIAAKARAQSWLDSLSKRFKEDPEKYDDVLEEMKQVDAELTEIDRALPSATTHAEALALRRRADVAWNKTYKNATYLRKRQQAVGKLREIQTGLIEDYKKALKNLQVWRDEVKADKVLEPRLRDSIVDVWEPQMKQVIEHYEAAVRNIAFVDNRLIEETLLDGIPRWKDVKWVDLESPLGGVLHRALEREKALR